MAAWRRAIELSLGDADTAKLRSIAQSRTEPASRVAVSLLAGIDLVTGKVHALARDRHRSREFIEFLVPHEACSLVDESGC